MKNLMLSIFFVFCIGLTAFGDEVEVTNTYTLAEEQEDKYTVDTVEVLLEQVITETPTPATVTLAQFDAEIARLNNNIAENEAQIAVLVSERAKAEVEAVKYKLVEEVIIEP